MLMKPAEQKTTAFFKELLKNESHSEPKKNYEYFAVSQVPDIVRAQFRVPNLLENKIRRLAGNRIVNAPFSKKIPAAEQIVYRNKIEENQWRHSYPLLAAKQDQVQSEQLPLVRSQSVLEPKQINQAKLEQEWSKLKALHKSERTKRKIQRGITNNRLYKVAPKKENSNSSGMIAEFEEPEHRAPVETRLKKKEVRIQPPVAEVSHPEPHALQRKHSRLIPNPIVPTATPIPPFQPLPVLPSENEMTIENEASVVRPSVDKKSVTGTASTLKKKKVKRRPVGVVIDDRLTIKEDQIREIDYLVACFDRHDMPIERAKLERALLGPLDIKVDLIQLPQPQVYEHILSDDEHPEDVRKRRLKQKNNIVRHAASTNILHVKTLVAEPKLESYKVRERFVSVYHQKPIHQFVQPKTNTWWTRKEYKEIRNSLFTYRQEKMLLQAAKRKGLPKLYRPESGRQSNVKDIAFRSTKQTGTTKEAKKYTMDGVLLDNSRPTSRLSNSRPTSALSDTPKAVFMDSNVFYQPHAEVRPARSARDRESQRQKLQELAKSLATGDSKSHDSEPFVL